MTSSTDNFAAEWVPIDGAHEDIQSGAMRRPEIGHQNGGNTSCVFALGVGVELPGGAASELTAPDATVAGSMDDLGMRMDRDMDRELVSFLPFSFDASPYCDP